MRDHEPSSPGRPAPARWRSHDVCLAGGLIATLIVLLACWRPAAHCPVAPTREQ